MANKQKENLHHISLKKSTLIYIWIHSANAMTKIHPDAGGGKQQQSLIHTAKNTVAQLLGKLASFL